MKISIEKKIVRISSEVEMCNIKLIWIEIEKIVKWCK